MLFLILPRWILPSCHKLTECTLYKCCISIACDMNIYWKINLVGTPVFWQFVWTCIMCSKGVTFFYCVPGVLKWSLRTLVFSVKNTLHQCSTVHTSILKINRTRPGVQKVLHCWTRNWCSMNFTVIHMCFFLQCLCDWDLGLSLETNQN